ncbi:hypothetical protein NPIL_160571 [Nephila pilipes]|uniref:Uncharacterized protein n=1 Tax=Nephila pilipes TaxID=299642 RepID=A0A8X6P2V1_NEPPI|nr:hypothetical protein NPIL_160571 [Nephila pilipes]
MVTKAIFVGRNCLSEQYRCETHEIIEELSSPEKYVSYLMMICLAEENSTSNVFQKLINVWSVVTASRVYIYVTSQKKFYIRNLGILTVFFENTLKSSFNKSGGCKLLEIYLASQDYPHFPGEFSAHLNDERWENFSKKVLDELLELSLFREKLFKSVMNKVICNRIWNNLTRQEVSTLDTSLGAAVA